MSEKEIAAESTERKDVKALSEKIQKEVNKLISIGKHRGSVTYDEVGEKIAIGCDATVNEIEEVLRILEENNIEVKDTKIDIVKDDSLDKLISDATISSDDPVKVYLKDIGKVPLRKTRRWQKAMKQQKRAFPKRTSDLWYQLQKDM